MPATDCVSATAAASQVLAGADAVMGFQSQCGLSRATQLKCQYTDDGRLWETNKYGVYEVLAHELLLYFILLGGAGGQGGHMHPGGAICRQWEGGVPFKAPLALCSAPGRVLRETMPYLNGPHEFGMQTYVGLHKQDFQAALQTRSGSKTGSACPVHKVSGNHCSICCDSMQPVRWLCMLCCNALQNKICPAHS